MKRLLAHYGLAAASARTVDEGLAPAIVLLAGARGVDPRAAGLLVAAAAAPHVITGPLAGAVLDTSPRRRAVLAAAPLVVGAVLGVLVLAVGHVPVVAAVGVVAIAGGTGPLLTGGLSAALGDVVAGDDTSISRAHAVDAASYNIAGLAGPLVVAAGAALLGGGSAGLLLLVSALLAGAGTATLPLRAAAKTGERALARGRQGVAALWRERPLRSTTIGSTVGAMGMGGLPLAIVERGHDLGSASTGPLLLGALAAGALAGSLVSARIRVPDERHVWVALAGLGAGLAGAALAPSAGLAALALLAGGVADGVLISAVFAVRTRHAGAGLRATVFTTAASLKISAAAAGAALGGLVVAAGGASAALLAAAAVQLLAALLVPLTARYPAPDGPPPSPAGRIPSRPT